MITFHINFVLNYVEALPGGVPCRPSEFRFGVYKRFSLIVGFAVPVAIWPREVVSGRNFILRAVTTFWAMSLVEIYPGRASMLSEIC